MMRSLWTAASGMTAQQFNVDVISNNLSNVNTTAFKKDRAEFKDLLYETLDRAYLLDGKGKPVNLQVGHGTANVATVKDFETGNLEQTGNPLDFAINGEAFFMVNGPKGQINYTRDGSFKISVSDEGKKLTTSDGFPVLDDAGNEIIINVDMSKLVVTSEGDLGYVDETGTTVPLGQKIGLIKFENRQGLLSMGKNLYESTEASGQPVSDIELGDKSTLEQGFLEGSNVKVVEEMVKLIVAQRAYEVNSKAIQTSDDMLGMANNLETVTAAAVLMRRDMEVEMEIGSVGSSGINPYIDKAKQSTAETTDDSFEARLNNAMEKKDDKELKSVCQQFESIMLGMVYKQMKATVPKSDFMQDDSATEIFQSMLDDELVEAASKRNSLGLADIMYKQLSKQLGTDKASAASKVAPGVQTQSAGETDETVDAAKDDKAGEKQEK